MIDAMQMHDPWAGSMWAGGMWLWAVLFWGLAIAGAVLVVKSLLGRGLERDADPLDILKRRYARGDIDRATFEQMKKDLEDSR